MQLRSNYVLRPGDQILIRAAEEEDLSNRPFLINEDGFIDLPLLGRTRAGGISVENFEAALVEALKKYVRVPQVSVTVVQFSSEPVFFQGAFKAPGIYPLVGQRNLVEMTAQVGGLAPGASKRIKVTRRKEYGAIPLPNAITLPDGNTSVEINIITLQNNVNPAEDIILQPFDIVSVEAQESVYVMGDARGVFVLGAKDSLSVLQVLAQTGFGGQGGGGGGGGFGGGGGGGFGGAEAGPKVASAVILRPIGDTARRATIPVDVQRIIKGQGNDVPLLPNDILYVSNKRQISARDLLLLLPFLGVALTIINLAHGGL